MGSVISFTYNQSIIGRMTSESSVTGIHERVGFYGLGQEILGYDQMVRNYLCINKILNHKLCW